MPKSNFNKVATLLKSHFGMSAALEFVAYFQNTFPRTTSEWLLLTVDEEGLLSILSRLALNLTLNSSALFRKDFSNTSPLQV